MDGSNPSRATNGGASGRSSGLYPLRRQISAAKQVRLLYPLPIFRAGSSTDQNSWPTPNRCGFNARTAHHAGLARRSRPRSITARRWFDSNILHHCDVGTWVTGRDGRCTRLLSEPRLVRFQRHPPDPSASLRISPAGSDAHRAAQFAGLADKDMHSPFKRDEVGSIPTSRTRSTIATWRHSITEQCAELLPRTMRVQISLPLPMWGCGPTDEGTRLRTLRFRVQFSASPPQ